MGVFGATAIIHGLKGDVDFIRDSYKGPVSASIFYAKATRFSDYVWLTSELQLDGHTGILPNPGVSVLYDPQGNGDKWCGLHMMVTGPAIERNANVNSRAANPGRDGDAYYTNRSAFAMINEICIRSANQDGPKFTGADLHDYYCESNPNAHNHVDPNINRWRTVPELKAASSTNFIWVAGCNMPFFQQRRTPHKSFPMNLVTAQVTELKVSFNPIYMWTVNEMEESSMVNPAKKGTLGVTPIANSDFNIRFFGNFLIMHPHERAAEREKILHTPHGIYRDLHYRQRFSFISTDSAGADLSYEVDANHPTNVIYIYFQPDSYMAGTAKSPYAVGYKDMFDYNTLTGGHSLYAFNVRLNTTDLLDASQPVSIWHAQWADFHHSTPQSSLIYSLPFDVKGVDNPEESKTFNPTNVEKLKIFMKKNVSDAGRVWIVFPTKNFMWFRGGFGAQQYT